MVSEGVREIIAWAGGNAVLDHRLTTPLAGHESRRRRAIVRLSTGPRGEDLSALLLRAERDGDCQEFRVGAAIVDPKEVPDGTTQSTSHP
ncbi:hypothetical protein MKK67_11225 [Methylobacterium sp. J-072]|uniref:hypothetical protein n=1 Tax=Methylobacterium sp. J-072 TaxID=2836651 RepID=UPI001FB9071D|nr:hypothetical protein [Methylobacterium sp. J-072]MCJ2093066.1 hypothetical protein [Methylobacterium sp. J-072]